MFMQQLAAAYADAYVSAARAVSRVAADGRTGGVHDVPTPRTRVRTIYVMANQERQSISWDSASVLLTDALLWNYRLHETSSDLLARLRTGSLQHSEQSIRFPCPMLRKKMLYLLIFVFKCLISNNGIKITWTGSSNIFFRVCNAI